MAHVIPAILAGFLLTGLIAATAFAAPFREIKDIYVWCSSGLTCNLTMEPKQSNGLSTLQIERRSGTYDGPTISFGSYPKLAENSILTFEVDGSDIFTKSIDELRFNEPRGEYTLTEPDDVAILLDAMKNGSVVGIQVNNGSSTTTTDYSLSGVVAGLIFIDEAQNRLDQSNALHVKGDLEPRMPNVLSVAALEELPLSLHRWFDGENSPCSFYSNSNRLTYGDGFVINSPYGALYVLPCGDGGAYNQPYALFYLSSSEDAFAERVSLPSVADTGPTVQTDAWNVSWDNKTRELSAFFKGRGLGDCGVSNIWAMPDRERVDLFVLKEIRSRPDCDGDAAGGIDNWPLVWPTAKN